MCQFIDYFIRIKLKQIEKVWENISFVTISRRKNLNKTKFDTMRAMEWRRKKERSTELVSKWTCQSHRMEWKRVAQHSTKCRRTLCAMNSTETSFVSLFRCVFICCCFAVVGCRGITQQLVCATRCFFFHSKPLLYLNSTFIRADRLDRVATAPRSFAALGCHIGARPNTASPSTGVEVWTRFE